MRILLASSEVYPYSKTGGLADMVGALGKFLARAGHDVGVVTPLYRGIPDQFPDLKLTKRKFNLPMGQGREQGGLWTRAVEDRLTIYFIDHPGYFDRPGLYQERGLDFPDNAARFIFFSKCVVDLARRLPKPPDLVHVHDWQAGLVPLLLLHQRATQNWPDPPRTCLTIHNLAYQGIFPQSQYGLTNLPWTYYHPEGVEFYGQLSSLKAGIEFANMITTVSPRYAREILGPELGCGLDGVLRRRQSSLVGILNGVDYEEWNTVANPHLQVAYSATDLAGKALNKIELQKELSLPVAPGVPLLASVSRLAEQKGQDLLLGALEEMMSANLQFVQLGNGSRELEVAYRKLAERHAANCAVRIGFDQALSHRIEAGADFFLMPSRFEPCGLNQMYSLHYGTVPIVRATGGLDDSVVDLTEDPDRADGIKFQEYSVRALAKAIRKGLVLYENKELLEHFRRNGMARDFSWERTAATYGRLFQSMF